MRVVVAGAGSVGRSIARELLAHDHEVVIVDRSPAAMRVAQVPDADWLLADACELSSLGSADVESADVVVGATGDDKVNLVFSLLCKTEFGVPRTVARVNNPKNEWMFDESWGVDVAVSTPRIMTAMVEEAVAVGDLVRIVEGRRGSVRVWSAATGAPVSPALLGHGGAIRSVSLSHDNRYLATGSLNGTVMVWDTSRLSGDPVETACELAGRPLTETEWGEYLPGVPYRDVCSEAP
jgi:trk system potassium uptake protein TrkA